jgi:hypothetical protein
MPTSGTNEVLRKVGYWAKRHPAITILLIVLVYAIWHSSRQPDEQSQEPPAKTQTKPNVSDAASVAPKATGDVNGAGETKNTEPPDIVPSPQAKDFAFNMTRTFQQDGLDIEVRAEIDNSLVLTSDLFEDEGVREEYVDALWKGRKKLCGMKIWYVKVGYSKGMFSSDVMKELSLGCPAEKAAHIQEMAPEREKAAATLSGDGLQVSVKGTTLLMDSDLFYRPSNCEQFVQKVANGALEKKKMCYLAVDRVQLTYHGKVVKTVPVICK